MWLLLVRPFDSLLGAKSLWGSEVEPGEAKSKGLPSLVEGSPILSGFMNEVRTFFEGEEG